MKTDFKNFRGLGLSMLFHSAKGSTWEEHKYIKRLNGTYYYPDDYEGGRHLPSSDSNDEEKPPTITTDESGKMLESDIEALAREVIRGDYGNGQVRKDLLGEFYQQVQDRVNEILRGKKGSTKISDVSEEEVKEAVETVEKAASSASSTPGLDFETIYSVYRKKN